MGFAWGLTAIGIALTWWLGGLKVLNEDITLGQLVIFSSFLVFAYEPVKYFTRDVKDHHRSIIALKHIQRILETSSSIDQESSRAIIQTLNRLKKDITIVPVSHHVQPTYEVDNIITIDRGIVVDVFEKACVQSDLNKIINYSDHLKYIYYFNDFVNHSDHQTMEEKNKKTYLNHDINDLSMTDKFIEYRVIGKTPEQKEYGYCHNRKTKQAEIKNPNHSRSTW